MTRFLVSPLRKIVLRLEWRRFFTEHESCLTSLMRFLRGRCTEYACGTMTARMQENTGNGVAIWTRPEVVVTAANDETGYLLCAPDTSL
jgi:hypothetical protein